MPVRQAELAVHLESIEAGVPPIKATIAAAAGGPHHLSHLPSASTLVNMKPSARWPHKL